MVRVSIFNKDRQLQGKIKLPTASLKFLLSGLVEYQNSILKIGVRTKENNKSGVK